MNLGPNRWTNISSTSADLATTMADRIRHAHQLAQVDETTDLNEVTAPAAAGKPSAPVDPERAKLRSELERLVANILSSDPQDTGHILDRAIETIVDDRLQGIDLLDREDLRQQVCDSMREDPTVIGELDSILQQIARQITTQPK